MHKKEIPSEALLELRRRLEQLPTRSEIRPQLIEQTAQLYGVSKVTVYRALRSSTKPKGAQRADQGKPRTMSIETLERYCEIIAALKVRTSNKKGRHLSTVQAIRLLEEQGIDTPDGFCRAPNGLAEIDNGQPLSQTMGI